MTSPILKGMKQNNTDVMLLKIDHWANIAPTTVVMRECDKIYPWFALPNNDQSNYDQNIDKQECI
jgi:hypothetical protein